MDVPKLRRRSVSVIASLSALAIAGVAQVGGPVATAAAASRTTVTAPATAAAKPATPLAAVTPTAGACPTTTAAGKGCISLKVTSARTVGPADGVHKGDAVTAYQWMINEDSTGDPGTAATPLFDRCLPSRAPGGSTKPTSPAEGDPTEPYADSCPWPSVRPTSGHSKIVAQGDQNDLGASHVLDGLAPGKYLVSVTADGYKIDGAHFVVTPGLEGLVSVGMQPLPLPLATIKIQVFNDNVPADGTYEADAEQGLAGFTGNLSDVLGAVSTDYYGNALCTVYLHDRRTGRMTFGADGKPVVDTTRSTGKCTSDRSGVITIPNLGPNRYGATVSPPAGQSGWVQTTTLEGGHDHDIWVQEGDTGLDTEFIKGAEPVPATQFGFVRVRAMRNSSATGEIKGVAVAGLPYIGGQNGQVVPETGWAGAKSAGPIPSPWIALSDLTGGDAAVYVGRGAANGSFDIKKVPDGTYQLTIWDDNQDYILWSFNVEVSGGDLVDVGNKMLVGWFTHVRGTVFVDDNGNGKRDPGEAPVPQFALTVRERDNTLMDQYTNTVTTNDQGVYDIQEGYPLSKWLVLEAFNTRYRTTGVTYQADNEDSPTTILGGLVDLNFLPVIGLSGRIDWGVEPYATNENGGIAATVSYDTTRNELDPADAVSEAYQPGIPDVNVHVYPSVPCAATTAEDKTNSCRQGKAIVPMSVPNPAYDANTNPGVPPTIPNPDPQRGALVKGPEVQNYTSEEWAPPRGCTARQWDGSELTDQLALPESGPDANNLCVEAPMMGVQAGASDSTPGAAGQTVNGNYGFGDLAAGDYIVAVEVPQDPVDGKPMYQVTREEDVNVFDGDTYLAQENFPPTSTEAASDGPQTGNDPLPPTQPPSQGAGIISACAGALHTVRVSNPTFLAGGGSPFEGQDRPLCDAKLITVRSGQTVAPNFNLFTPVPIPTHFWGLTINDLGLALDKRSANYGEAQGLPNVPVGLYDWSGRLVDTTHTDFNGFYEALEPSTSTYNCPVPAGPCPNMYRFTGNDPGGAGDPNPDYNPAYRTISTNFQGWPGLYTVTDTAPTQAAATVLAPGTTASNPARCDLGTTDPQLLAVSKPYVRPSSLVADRTVTVTGKGFGTAQGTGSVTLKNAAGATVAGVTVSSWSDTRIAFTVPAASSSTGGALKVSITNGSKRSTYNGITIWNLGSAPGNNASTVANPNVAEVGPGKQYATVQAALEAARPTSSRRYWLVVVWPGAPTALNPRGEYNENLLVHHRVAIQGVGPGGFIPTADGSQQWVPGSIIDGSGFSPDLPGGTAWINLLAGLRYSGEADVPDAATITVLDDPAAAQLSNTAYPVAIDGLQVTGGAQSDFPGNVNVLTGGIKTPYGATGALVTQGGGIYLHNNNRSARITDNVIVGNSGSYGGGIRVGTPYTGDNRNYDTVIADNQVLNNGGTNLAGGIGLFTGSDGYKVQHNAICGNFSAEYGGAMTAFGYMSNFGGNNGGTISGNTVWFNSSYDEGGAIMLAGELPSDPTGLSQGTGAVTVDSNVIDANIASDDGGGIRLLQVAGSHVTKADPQWITITNNTVTNNVSAHEGGGVALDDAPFVKFVNNTVAGNLTTATAVTSDGLAAPAGLSTGPNSVALMARLGGTTFSNPRTSGQATFSNPILLNNVFNDNRAGNFLGGYVYGIGGTLPDGTANTTNHWDMGVVGGPGVLHPIGSVIQTTDGTDTGELTKVTDTPGFVDPTPELTVTVLASRTYPAFREAAIVTALLPPRLRADYHLTGVGAVAHAVGPVTKTVTLGTANNTAATPWTVIVPAATSDIDGDLRPTSPAPPATPIDAGSDQVRP